uniref:Uncharacterized protein n=1 Tax=Vespula pensylvanica TaxID=30213 RepID=A0A834KMH3_VESPE|nr:hypothetical protein H0235_014227 [Vespula pensylvanica]
MFYPPIKEVDSTVESLSATPHYRNRGKPQYSHSSKVKTHAIELHTADEGRKGKSFHVAGTPQKEFIFLRPVLRKRNSNCLKLLN